MDGLTISTGKQLLETGKTFSEMSKKRVQPESVSDTVQSFQDTLKTAVEKVDALQKDADVKMQQLASGEKNNISEVMIATEKADIALKLMMSVRNKVIDAYQEIMRMQV